MRAMAQAVASARDGWLQAGWRVTAAGEWDEERSPCAARVYIEGGGACLLLAPGGGGLMMMS